MRFCILENLFWGYLAFITVEKYAFFNEYFTWDLTDDRRNED